MGREIHDLASCAAAECTQLCICARGDAATRQIIQEVPNAGRCRRRGGGFSCCAAWSFNTTVKLVHQHQVSAREATIKSESRRRSDE